MQLPFKNDEAVIEKWENFDFIAAKEDFNSEGSGDYRWGGFDTDYYVFLRA